MSIIIEQLTLSLTIISILIVLMFLSKNRKYERKQI